MSHKITKEEFETELQKKNPNLQVIELNGVHKPVQIHCKECGQDFNITYYNLKKSCRCPVCNGGYFVAGYNSIADKRPDLLKYFKNKNQAEQITCGSHAQIELICPVCGRFKRMIAKDFVKRGFVCDYCSDTISYPNKFIRKYLDIIKEFTEEKDYEKVFEWSEGLIYDGYFKLRGKKYVIEMHGEQHYKNSEWGTFENVHSNDLKKKKLAIENEFEYIEIDCKKSEFNYIKDNIQKSILGKLFQLEDKQWQTLEEFLCQNFILIIKEKYEKGLNAIEIGKQISLERHAVYRYLKKLKDAGLILYTGATSRNIRITIKNEKGQEIYRAKSLQDAAEYTTQNYHHICTTTLKKFLDSGKTYYGCYFYKTNNKAND